VIGVVSALITSIFAQKYLSIFEKRNKLISSYIEPLAAHILTNIDRLDANYVKMKKHGLNNPIRMIEGKKVTQFENDVRGKRDMLWFYKHGNDLGATCYFLASLIASIYRVKYGMSAIPFKKKFKQKLMGHISKFQEILESNRCIYYATQCDIGQLMYDNQDRLISYNDFCKLALASDDRYHCFIQLFDFIIASANAKVDEAEKRVEMKQNKQQNEKQKKDKNDNNQHTNERVSPLIPTTDEHMPQLSIVDTRKSTPSISEDERCAEKCEQFVKLNKMLKEFRDFLSKSLKIYEKTDKNTPSAT
jgi:hypothetical protein